MFSLCRGVVRIQIDQVAGQTQFRAKIFARNGCKFPRGRDGRRLRKLSRVSLQLEKIYRDVTPFLCSVEVCELPRVSCVQFPI